MTNKKREIKKCINCGNEKLSKTRESFSLKVKGRTKKISGIEHYFCSECGEIFLDLENEFKLDVIVKKKGKDLRNSA